MASPVNLATQLMHIMDDSFPLGDLLDVAEAKIAARPREATPSPSPLLLLAALARHLGLVLFRFDSGVLERDPHPRR